MHLFNPEIKHDIAAQGRVRKWIEALRSDTYEQATGRLRGDDGFCCLGVACDLAKDAVGDERWVRREGGWEWEFSIRSAFGTLGVGDVLLSGETQALPPTMQSIYQIVDDIGSYSEGSDDDGTVESLAGQNDHGMTFEQIADIIEEEFNAFGPFPEIGPVPDRFSPVPWRP